MSFVSNAIITSAEITIEDHDILDMWLMLDYGGSGQGFGGYALAVSPSSPHWPGNKNIAGIFIRRCLDIAGAGKFSQLKGKTIRVRKVSEFGSIVAIGHIIRDDWFYPQAEFGK